MFNKEKGSPFIDPAAVEAWDAWFRWREGGRLLDLSIEATWMRVAAELSAVEPENAAYWQKRFYDALSSWRLVLDERILASAGTSRSHWRQKDFVAVLNAAMFVTAPFSHRAQFDYDAFLATAELAVRALDNTLPLRDGVIDPDCDVRVGVIGVADALALLGLRYDSPEGCACAARIAKSLAEGSMSGNVRLATERGPRFDYSSTRLVAAQLREMRDGLMAEAATRGLRHPLLTSIVSSPKLALLANNVADALDPLEVADNLHTIETQTITRAVRSSGYAALLAQRHAVALISLVQPRALPDELSVPAQLALRGAMQPWIDWPIDYPICVSRQPDAKLVEHWQQLAAVHRLGEPCWRIA